MFHGEGEGCWGWGGLGVASGVFRKLSREFQEYYRGDSRRFKGASKDFSRISGALDAFQAFPKGFQGVPGFNVVSGGFG